MACIHHLVSSAPYLLEIRVEMAPNLWLAGLEIQGEGGGEGKCRSLQELALELGVQDSG